MKTVRVRGHIFKYRFMPITGTVRTWKCTLCEAHLTAPAGLQLNQNEILHLYTGERHCCELEDCKVMRVRAVMQS